MKFVKKFFVVTVSLIVLILLLNCFSSITIFPRIIVPENVVDAEFEKELRQRDNFQIPREIDWVRLDYARNGLIVLHNSRYAIVLCEQEGTWTITQILNPDPLRHFFPQGSTVSSVDVDDSEQYIAIHSIGIDDVDDPLYIFNLHDSQFTEYVHDDFPEDLHFSSVPTNLIPSLMRNIVPPREIKECMYDHGTNTVVFFDVDDEPLKEVKLKSKPNFSVYLYDDSTIVYISESFLNSKIIFQDIEMGRVQKIVIR